MLKAENKKLTPTGESMLDLAVFQSSLSVPTLWSSFQHHPMTQGSFPARHNIEKKSLFQPTKKIKGNRGKLV